MFDLIDVGERAGTGINRLYSVWREMHYSDPVIKEEFDPERTIVSINIETVVEESIVSDLELPEKQLLVYNTILNNPYSSATKLAKICNMKVDNVETAIKGLKKKELIFYSKDSGKKVIMLNNIRYPISEWISEFHIYVFWF